MVHGNLGEKTEAIDMPYENRGPPPEFNENDVGQTRNISHDFSDTGEFSVPNVSPKTAHVIFSP